MKAAMIAFLGNLTFQYKLLLPLLQEHLEDQNGEILPHVFMADIARWCISRIIKGNGKDRIVLNILHDFENIYHEYEEIDELIMVSFLENLPKKGEKGSLIREILRPKLKKQLEMLEQS